MYEDDYLDPTLENDYEEDDYHSINSMNDASYTSRRSHIRKNVIKIVNKAYHTTKVVNKETGSIVKVGFYETSFTPGCYIKNAISGNSYSYKVGSANEDLVFKVNMATGITGQNACILFYSYPEEFEKHMCTKVSETIKRNWKDKYDKRAEQVELLAKKVENVKGTVVH
jgi:hypothetical protein